MPPRHEILISCSSFRCKNTAPWLRMRCGDNTTAAAIAATATRKKMQRLVLRSSPKFSAMRLLAMSRLGITKKPCGAIIWLVKLFKKIGGWKILLNDIYWTLGELIQVNGLFYVVPFSRKSRKFMSD